MHTRTPYLCLLLILSVFYPGIGLAQQPATLKATLAHAKIGLGEEVELEYAYSGDDAKSFTLPPHANFTVVSGPMQSTVSSSNLVNGNMVMSTAIRLSYTIKPTDTGVFVLGPGSLKTKDDKIVLSNELTIQVVPGNNINHDNFADATDLYSENFELLLKLKAGTDNYIVSAGPVYRWDHKLKYIADSIEIYGVLASVGKTIEKYTTSSDRGNHVWDDRTPRKYFSVKDTTGLSAALNDLYKQDAGAAYLTCIDKADRWFPGSDEFKLKNMRSFFGAFDSLTKRLAVQGKDTLNEHKIRIVLNFNDKAGRKAFSRQARQSMFAIKSSKKDRRELKDRKIKLYSLAIETKTALDHKTLISMAELLAALAEPTKAQYISIAVADE